MCGSNTRNGETIYIWSYGYPGNGGAGMGCQCKIHSTASEIVIQTYDNRIANSQSLELFSRNISLTKWIEDKKFNNITTEKVHLNAANLTLTWDGGKDAPGKGKGKFWIRIRGEVLTFSQILFFSHTRVIPEIRELFNKFNVRFWCHVHTLISNTL